ncbi:MAG TPA: hypothetical protein PL137_24390, partial [Nocardioides sp.]|nr:hypothetical protein [Nocardioides sp.]
PSGSGNQVGAGDLTSPTIGASLGMKSPFLQEADGAGLEIPAGGTLDVSIAGNANLARLLQAGNPQAAAMAANIQHIAVNSDAITLKHKGKPIAKLLSLRVLRGGQVTLDRFEMLGGLGAGAGFESLLRIIVGTIALAERGVPPQLGAQVTVGSGNAEPELVRGVSRQMIEQGLSSAVQKLLRDNRNAVPGLDLGPGDRDLAVGEITGDGGQVDADRAPAHRPHHEGHCQCHELRLVATESAEPEGYVYVRDVKHAGGVEGAQQPGGRVGEARVMRVV